MHALSRGASKGRCGAQLGMPGSAARTAWAAAASRCQAAAPSWYCLALPQLWKPLF